MKKIIFPFALCAVVCLAIGFVIGRTSSGEEKIATLPRTGTADKAGVPASRISSLPGNTRDEKNRIPIPKNGFTKEGLMVVAQEMNSSLNYGPEKMRQLLSVYEALRRQDVGALVRELMDEEGPRAQQALFLAMGAYLEQSPGPALDLVLQNTSNPHMRGSLYQAVQANMKLNPHQTLERLKNLEDRQLRGQLVNLAISTMAANDPEQALDMYLANSSLMAGANHSVSGIFHQWALKDPGKAAAALSKIQDPDTRNQATANLVSSWANSDPEAAWNWALKQPVSDHNYNDLRVRLLNVWANQDPQAALGKALSLESRQLQNSVLPNIVRQWAQKDVDAALSWVLSLQDSTLLASSMQQIVYSNSVDPGPLFDILVRDMPAGGTFENSVSNVMSRWAREDPEAAAVALSSLPMGDAFRNGAGAIVREWSKKNPAEAFQWVLSLPEGAARNNTLNTFLNSSVRNDSDQARQFFSALNPNEQKKYAATIVSGLASKNIDEAIDFSFTIADTDQRARAFKNIASTWARKDPQAAGEWAMGLNPSERSSVVSGVVQSWARVNVEAAAAWLASKPASPDLDAATAQLSRELVGVDPVAAMEWAQTITDENQRKSALYRNAERWKRNDPQTARSWIQNSRELTADQKENLLK